MRLNRVFGSGRVKPDPITTRSGLQFFTHSGFNNNLNRPEPELFWVGSGRVGQVFCPPLMFIDDFSRYGYIYLLQEKSQSLDIFKIFKVEVENQLGKRIKSIISYHGGKYYGKYDSLGKQYLGLFAKFLEKCIIIQ